MNSLFRGLMSLAEYQSAGRNMLAAPCAAHRLPNHRHDILIHAIGTEFRCDSSPICLSGFAPQFRIESEPENLFGEGFRVLRFGKKREPRGAYSLSYTRVICPYHRQTRCHTLQHSVWAAFINGTVDAEINGA